MGNLSLLQGIFPMQGLNPGLLDSLPAEPPGEPILTIFGFPHAQLVKNPPAMWETLVQFLGWEDPLEKGTATQSRILAWRIPWTI